MKKLIFAIAAALMPLSANAQFLSAAEVRPILDMTTANWVGVSEYNGQDLLYFSHLISFRCGLTEIRYGINGEPAISVFPLEECYRNTNAPTAMHPDTNPLFLEFPPGTLQLVTVEIEYDDGGTQSVTYFRNEIVIP